jgi:excisionase family DNA binding protein
MDQNNQLERQALSIQEAAKIIGISDNRAYKAAKTGEIPTIRIGKRNFVPRPALQRMLEQAGLKKSSEHRSESALD